MQVLRCENVIQKNPIRQVTLPLCSHSLLEPLEELDVAPRFILASLCILCWSSIILQESRCVELYMCRLAHMSSKFLLLPQWCHYAVSTCAVLKLSSQQLSSLASSCFWCLLAPATNPVLCLGPAASFACIHLAVQRLVLFCCVHLALSDLVLYPTSAIM